MANIAAPAVPRIMTAADAVALYDLGEAHGTPVWLDGGWAVDALLGEQTRPHADLDIVLEMRHLDRLVALLRERGYVEQERGDTTPWNFVLGDPAGRDVDFHAFVFDEWGDGVYGPPERPFRYPPAGSLSGLGAINGRRVRCVSPEQLVAGHCHYQPDNNDVRDVLALCERFDIPIPPMYQAFAGTPRAGDEAGRA